VAAIIAIVNNKGGVGKTTVTCNLAHALGRLGKRVLVVDLDSQCNATALLLPKNLALRQSLYEMLAPETLEHPLQTFMYPTRYSGCSVFPMSRRPLLWSRN
jgi:chromosome partitioning protein